MSLWLLSEPLVLASKSKIRRMILDSAGIPIEVIPAEIDEREIDARAALGSDHTARLLAEEKAKSVSSLQPARLVLGADQTLALGGHRFSKPVDRHAAREQLQTMRGRRHALHSGYALVRDGHVLCAEVDTAQLTMRDFSDEFLDRYLSLVGQAVVESVGGYQLEGIGVHLFDRIEGDHFTILGLPLLRLLAACRRLGFVA
jgi:nucleoside triphosphate pyrophosphatase